MCRIFEKYLELKSTYNPVKLLEHLILQVFIVQGFSQDLRKIFNNHKLFNRLSLFPKEQLTFKTSPILTSVVKNKHVLVENIFEI